MPTSIVKYAKATTPWTTIVMRFPDSTGRDDQVHCTELATLDGITYVSVPEGVQLPEQPPEITLEKVTLTPELKAAIRDASTHCHFIDERRQLMLRGKYSADDEAHMSRVSQKALLSGLGIKAIPSDLLTKMRDYDAHAESCVEWARAERAKLGL